MRSFSTVPAILARDSNRNTRFTIVTDDGEPQDCTHAGQVTVQFEVGHFIYLTGRGKHAVGTADVAGKPARVAVPFRNLPMDMRAALEQGVPA